MEKSSSKNTLLFFLLGLSLCKEHECNKLIDVETELHYGMSCIKVCDTLEQAIYEATKRISQKIEMKIKIATNTLNRDKIYISGHQGKGEEDLEIHVNPENTMENVIQFIIRLLKKKYDLHFESFVMDEESVLMKFEKQKIKIY